MFNLSSYLEKFKNLKDPKENKSVVSKIIYDVAGIVIPEEDIDIQKEKIFLQTNALAKSRVFIKKEEILEKIKNNLPDISIKEIV